MRQPSSFGAMIQPGWRRRMDQGWMTHSIYRNHPPKLFTCGTEEMLVLAGLVEVQEQG